MELFQYEKAPNLIDFNSLKGAATLIIADSNQKKNEAFIFHYIPVLKIWIEFT